MPLGERFDTTLAAARTGAEWAWRELYGDLAPTLLGYLRRAGAADAEDLVAEVFLQVVRKLASFDGAESGFRSWVFTIAHHRLIDDRRQRARRPATPTPVEELAAHMQTEDEVESDALERVAAREIEELLTVLTDDQREVIVLRLSGFTVTDVAGITGRTANATKALQRRGLRSLERALAAGRPSGRPRGKRV